MAHAPLGSGRQTSSWETSPSFSVLYETTLSQYRTISKKLKQHKKQSRELEQREFVTNATS